MRGKTKIYVLLVLLFAILIPSKQAEAAVASQRLDGANRFEVAVNVSKNGWPNGANTVILTNYLAFADALSATPYAFKEDAPILLTHADKLTPESKIEIQRLNPSKIVIVGGPGSVSETVVQDLQAVGFGNIERIGGQDRFEVSYNLALKIGNISTAVVANGLNFPDALSIAPYAAKNGFPILLVRNNELPGLIRNAISQLNITNTIISGGEASVSKGVESNLPAPQRIGGKDRYEVSANIVNTLEASPTKAFIATGMTFADALTGSVLAAKQGAPLLLTHTTSAPSSVKSTIVNKNISDFVILGGTASVPQQTFNILTGQEVVPPLAGKVIMLDPGHGGVDPGAVQNGYKEVDLNNSFTLKVASYLNQMGAQVLYTRNPNQNVYVSLEERANIANSSNAEIFISIHHDSNVSSSPRGLSTHYSSYRPAIETTDVYVLSGGVKYPFISENTDRKEFLVRDGSGTKALSYTGNNIAYDPTPSVQAQNSKVLGEGLAQSLQYPGVGISNIYSSTGTKDHNLYVTRWTKMTSVLIELGFISNPDEVKILANLTVQEQRAKAMAEQIKAFLTR
jgi:N-acetylmuramoyl-L-alanine amidase